MPSSSPGQYDRKTAIPNSKNNEKVKTSFLWINTLVRIYEINE